MATKFENLSPQEVLTSKAIRWTRPTGRRIIIFCARHQLSQNTLDPYLLGRLMVSLGWSIEMPAYKHLAKRVARYITAHVTADKLSPAFSETKHGSSYTVTWRSYTEHWNENSEFDPDSIDPPPGDDGSVREPVTREYLTLEKCVDQLAQMRMNASSNAYSCSFSKHDTGISSTAYSSNSWHIQYLCTAYSFRNRQERYADERLQG
ncbi:hypothetical protein Tdes44962_MAKER06525 [Teratosphaeria destructans]|uniref:Uncharacterized protein n=1 Tax=Teratosphaeria destructans TaxID=418781 RepID=A0A9W7T1X1_9PEZI|nr:hypothetical protein Tdes44962_MAKER06525 [Teratosphaeria destructans]